jgi:hypothetical protein
MNTKGALWKALCTVLVLYVISVSSIADYLAHQCGRYWFEYTFQLTLTSWVWIIFSAIGIIMFIVCLIRHVGIAAQWWFWLAFAVIVLIANSLYAQTAPVSLTAANGSDLQCAVKR